jgi:CRP/FNR family transcriptional regulator, dissimilatory nitrate respiration regulator
MNIPYQIISTNPLFDQIEESDLMGMLDCLCARVHLYQRDSYIILAGDEVRSIGIVLKGKVCVERESEDGVRNLVTVLMPGECFGESFACSNHQEAFVSVVAVEDCEILFLDCKKIVTTCSSACTFHTRLIENILSMLSDKILGLNQKLEIVSKRKIREKLVTFFEAQKKNAGSNVFSIPYNREQLADFLFVDRSALSNELGKMRDEGLIRFQKNKFEILNQQILGKPSP